MANPFSPLLSRFGRQPAPEAPVIKDTSTFAYGLALVPDAPRKDSLGQPQDTDYDLLYAVYKKHTDVSACVDRWVGGVTGKGWRIGLLDTEATPTAAQERQIKEITTWLKNPNPSKRFSLMLEELVMHLGITGDSYLHKTRNPKTGKLLELWGVHPSTLRVVSDEYGALLGYVQVVRGRVVASFKPEEISHFRLANPNHDLYGQSPLERALEEVGLDLSAIRSNKAMFQNGLKPSTIVLFNDGMVYPFRWERSLRGAPRE